MTVNLRAMSLFEGLSDRQLDHLQAASTRSVVEPGADILREGEQSTALFILLDGKVEVTKRLGFVFGRDDADGPRKTLVRLTAPQFFGEMALLGDSERTATVTAITRCELMEIGKASFDGLVQADVQLGYRLLYNLAIVLCERLRRTDRDVLKLTAALSLALGNR